jgi:hypothetical protein
MTQLTQFLVTKGELSIHVHPASLAAYLAAGYVIQEVQYSEGAEAVDDATQFLLTLGSASIHVKADDLQSYLSAGWAITKILYGASQTPVFATAAPISFLDIPAFSSAEVGDVAATKVVVTFTTEVSASNYATGVTIKVDDVSKTISAATRQTDHKVVHYTIPAVAFGEVVTWSYDDATGLIRSEVDESPLDDVTDGAVTNNVAEE